MANRDSDSSMKRTQVFHGESRTRIYKIYHGMIDRCYNSNLPYYKFYGQRGIYVCDDWRGPRGFVNFRDWAYSHGYSDSLSLDRIDNDGPYAPGNCRWIDKKTQSRNMRSNRVIEAFGESHCISEWSELTGMPINMIRYRLSAGWDVEMALTKPKTRHELWISAFGRTQRLAEWSREVGLDESTIKSRIEKGMTPEDALTAPLAHSAHAKKYAAFGKELIIREWHEETGISTSTIWYRIKKGWDMEDVVSIPVGAFKGPNAKERMNQLNERR